MKKIAVLLAVYNGEGFLHVLLGSLINQTYKKFIVFIHDDGSTDNTRLIINTYIDKGLNIIILEDTAQRTGRGAKGSFMWLLEKVDADYYMFCDQDDLWLPYKIEQSVQYIVDLERERPHVPICVHTDLAVVDANYNVLSNSLWRQSKVKPNVLEDPTSIQIFNCVTGCTMIFNQLAKECALPMHELAPMHDFWVAYQTLTHNGILTHLPFSTILYCQHGNNEVGANDVGYYYLFNKITHIKKIILENVEKYKIMHTISGISWRRFLYYKLSFEIRRIL